MKLYFILFAILSSLLFANQNYVFDLTGSQQGHGDVVGPWSALLGIKAKRPDNNYIVITDIRAVKSLEQISDASITQIEKEYGVQIIDESNLSEAPTADVYFQLFFGGRIIKTYDERPNFTRPILSGDKTITIVSDTMHGTTLDEAFGENFRIFFKPPGLGEKRSGILNAPALYRLMGRSPAQLQVIAASLFKEQGLKDLFLKQKSFENAQISFMYGAHNEVKDWGDEENKKLLGQTKEYVEALKEYYGNEPIFIISPETIKTFEEALPNYQNILTPKQLSNLKPKTNTVYVISMPDLSDMQFSGALATADLPILVEGNSAIASAIRLHKEFLVYRSPWNEPQVSDILKIDSEQAGSWLYSDVYKLGGINRPIFSRYFAKKSARKLFAQYYLSGRTNDFVSKLILVVDIAEALNSKNLEKAQKLAQNSGDEYLKYSIVFDQNKEELEKLQNSLKKRGVSWQEIENRLKPNKLNKSTKIELINESVQTIDESNKDILLQVINLARSTARRQIMEKQLAKLSKIPHHFIEAIDGKKVDINQLKADGWYPKQTLRTAGELGIYLSTLKRAIPGALNSPLTITLEDDTKLPHEFEIKLKQALKAVPADWDMLYLGCNEDYYSNENGDISKNQTPDYNYSLCPSQDLQSTGTRWKKMTQRCIAGTWAYVLNPQSAKKLSENLLPIAMPVDNKIAKLIGEDKIQAYCASPELVTINLTLESTIR